MRLLITTIFCVISFLFLFSCNSSDAQPGTKTESTDSDDSVRFNKRSPESYPRAVVKEAYRSAIAEYINAEYQNAKPLPDTLFIGRNMEFPEIELPSNIERANLLLIDGDNSWNRLKQRASLTYLNVMGWMSNDKTEFMIVTFADGGKPQHNCHEYFTHLPANNTFRLDSVRFEYPYSK